MEPSTYSQVVFNDIPQSYPANTTVTCHYSVTASLQPNPSDWVGICKVGWSSPRDYHTFVWVEPPLDVVGEEPVRKYVIFREYYLPKDESEFYQFCYVDSKAQVRGVSTPFCFKTPGQLSVDCSLDNDLLVITTQEQLELSDREKEDLVKDLEQMREQNKTTTGELLEKKQEIERLKASRNELAQKAIKLEQQQHHSRENEELNRSTTSMVEPEREKKSLTPLQDKYDQAVININKLEKERDGLRREIEEIAQPSRGLKTSEEEQRRLKDHIQLLKVDFQSSEKEKERLCAELHRLHDLTHDLENLKTENQGLRKSLSEREALQEMTDGELKEARTQLHQEEQVSNDVKRRAERAERELEEVTTHLENSAKRSLQETLEISKLEMQLTELYSQLEEKENKAEITEKEKDELTRENLDLKGDIERLCREFADLQAAPPPIPVLLQHSNPYSHPPDRCTSEDRQEVSDTLHYGNPYENSRRATDPEEELFLKCRHCQETFPGITQEELELHEHSHRVCPFCTLVCDFMEQAEFEDHVYSHEV